MKEREGRKNRGRVPLSRRLEVQQPSLARLVRIKTPREGLVEL